MRKTKKVFKLFYIFDLEKEETWLREMANKGWFFQKVNILGIYTFFKGQCKDTIYKIDFNRNIEDIEEYYSLFSQSGWQFINKIREFKYFKYTGEISNYSSEVDIYNEPKEQLTWLRKWLIVFLIAYGIDFVSLYSLIFFQNTNYSDFNLMIIIILGFIALLSCILVRFINSYTKLNKKIKEKRYKDYYNKNYSKKAFSIISLLIFPILTCVLLSISLTFLCTVGGSEKAVKNKVLQSDSTSLYPMNKIDYIAVRDISKYRVCLYGNNDRIGLIALEKLFLNRYKVTTNFSCCLPSNQFMITESLSLEDNKYSIIYGKDEKKELYKVVLIYKDGSKDEVTQDTFIREDKYFMILQKTKKSLNQIKAYNKDNVDVTSKYNK